MFRSCAESLGWGPVLAQVMRGECAGSKGVKRVHNAQGWAFLLIIWNNNLLISLIFFIILCCYFIYLCLNYQYFFYSVSFRFNYSSFFSFRRWIFRLPILDHSSSLTYALDAINFPLCTTFLYPINFDKLHFYLVQFLKFFS